MGNLSFRKALKRRKWKEKYRMLIGGYLVCVYKKKKLACEVSYGYFGIKEILFFDVNGTILQRLHTRKELSISPNKLISEFEKKYIES